MKQQIFLAVFALLMVFTSCSGSNEKQADDKSSEQVTAVIDSLLMAEPDMSISSLSVIKSPMPAILSEELEPAIKQSGEMLALFLFSKAMGGHDSSRDSDKMVEEFISMGAPLREAIKKYDAEDHPEYVFGLAKVVNEKDSSKNEKRLYVFEENNLSQAIRVEKLPSKSDNDLEMIFALAYGDKLDLAKKDSKLEDIQAINENAILKFIVTGE